MVQKDHLYKPINTTLSIVLQLSELIDHFARCKQHWSRSTSCFSFL